MPAAKRWKWRKIMTRKNQNLTPAEAAIKRQIAASHGYTISRGPRTGEGSALQLDLAIISGEVATLLIGEEDRRAVCRWIDENLDAVAADDWIAAGALYDIREALLAALARATEEY